MKLSSMIESFCNRYAIEVSNLIYANKMSAKVDNTAVQDGYRSLRKNGLIMHVATLIWQKLQKTGKPSLKIP